MVRPVARRSQELKELELAHEDAIRELKQENDKNVTKLRQQYEREVKELQQKYERKMRLLRDDLELRRKVRPPGCWRAPGCWRDACARLLARRAPRAFDDDALPCATAARPLRRWRFLRLRSARTTTSTS